VNLARLALAQVLVVTVLAAVAWAAGRGSLLLLRLPPAAIPASLTLTVGMAALAQTALLLGLVGLLKAPLIAALAAVGCTAAAWDLYRAPPRRAAIGVSVVALLIAAPGAALTLFPPLGFDQTMYHLPMARAFAATGAVPFLPALRYPIFPPLAEVLNAAILTSSSDVGTQAAGWLALAVTLGVVFVWARDVATPAAGWVAVAIIGGSPLAWYLASTGYVEPLLGLLGAGACLAADRARRDPHVGWLLLAGGLAGSAAGVKYLGLYFVPAALLVAVARPPWTDGVRRGALYAVAATLALAPSYGRLLAHTGNPLFPFYPEVFGPSPWAAPEFLGPRGADRLAAAAVAFWDAAFRPARIGGLPVLSPAVALGAPLVLLAMRRRPGVAIAAALTAGYLALAPVHAHYLLAVVPAWSVAIGAAAGVLAGPSAIGRAVLVTAAAVLVAWGGRSTIARLQALGPPPVDLASRDRLLADQRPLYPAIQFLNRVDPGVPVYGVSAENMVDDRIGPLLGDYNGPASFARMEARMRALGSVAAALDAIGARYLLLREDGSAGARLAAADPRLARVFADGHASVYRVIPAAPAARDSGDPPRPD
jgi:hypothetical protein